MTREEEINKASREIGEPMYNEDKPVHEIFCAAAQWADAHPVNHWHKASEELPKMAHFTTDGDFSDLCVCINESGEHKILVLCEDSDYTYWAYGYDGEGLYDEDTDGGEITHWMPIPEIKED